MQIRSVETTPNPNSIKLNFSEPVGATATYFLSSPQAPEFVGKLLAIDGLQSVFVCGDFITLNRHPLADWRQLLEQATLALTGEKVIDTGPRSSSSSSSSSSSLTLAATYSAAQEGQIQILVQTFCGVPMQVKAVDVEGETRLSLGSHFNEAAQQIQKITGADFLKERQWLDHGWRYGPRAEMAEQVVLELHNYFSSERLDLAVSEAIGKKKELDGSEKSEELNELEKLADFSAIEKLFRDHQWQQRLLAVQELSRLDISQSPVAINLLIAALQDSNAQVRRLAAAALGTTGSARVVPALCQTLIEDSSIAVRRTAGDALSDIGDASAAAAMNQALKDGNKLVRWRAARFLNDLGAAESLPFLEAALQESEYEVLLEINAAIDRIKGGGQGAGPAWRRIADLRA